MLSSRTTLLALLALLLRCAHGAKYIHVGDGAFSGGSSDFSLNTCARTLRALVALAPRVLTCVRTRAAVVNPGIITICVVGYAVRAPLLIAPCALL
jgi:hypothetical protein